MAQLAARTLRQLLAHTGSSAGGTGDQALLSSVDSWLTAALQVG